MSNKIVFLLIGVLLVLMLGLGGGLFMMWNKLSDLNAQSMANAANNPDMEENIEHPLGPIFSLDTFIVNLADKGGNRYLRVTMDLELGNPELGGVELGEFIKWVTFFRNALVIVRRLSSTGPLQTTLLHCLLL